MPDGYSTYKLWASGNVHCGSCLATLDLARRQDAFSTYLLSLVYPAQDLCHLDIPLDRCETLCFYLCRKKEATAVHQREADLKSFAKPRKPEDIPPSLQVFADSMEAVDTLLSKRVKTTISKFEQSVQLIHISDQMEGVKKKALRATFKLPSDLSKMGDITELIAMTLHLVSVAARPPPWLSEKTRKQIENQRQSLLKQVDVEKRLQMEQRMQQKKIDKQKAEKENVENLSKEAQRKREEKEYKKELKSRMPKMKMMK